MCVLSLAGLHSCRQRPEVKPQAAKSATTAIPDIQRVGAAVDLSKTDWINTADKGTGFLIVKNDSVLRSLAVALRNKTPEERKAWAAQYGFLSMQQVYETAAQAGEKQQEFLQKFPNALRQDPQAGLLPNIHDYDLAHLVNPDGLIMVAGHLFQYSRQQVKRMDTKKGIRPISLMMAKQNEKALDIEVNPVINKFTTPTASARLTPFEYFGEIKINPGSERPNYYPFLWADDARAFFKFEATETAEPYFGPPSSVCFGNCEVAIASANTENYAELSNNSSDCICYYVQPIVGYTYITRANVVFQTDWRMRDLVGSFFYEIFSSGHVKRIQSNLLINGFNRVFDTGNLSDRGNIFLSIPLSFVTLDGSFRSNTPNAVNISGAILFTNQFLKELAGDSFPQQRVEQLQLVIP